MKVFNDSKKDKLYFIYRMINPLFDPIRFYNGFTGYFWYIRDLIHFKILEPKQKIFGQNLYPELNDKTELTAFDAHYFYQQIWVFDKVLSKSPKRHVDIGSTYQMSGYLSKITKITFVDIRPITADLKNLKTVKGSILNLPFESDSIESLSCLHVAEHIGLGRYGDPIDSNGTKKACRELSRVLKPGGFLYFSVPIGKERICFNAHRIFSPTNILGFFPELSLIEFSLVDDDGKFVQKTKPGIWRNLKYGCGLFQLTKK